MSRVTTKPLPKAYWQDQDWTLDHYSELADRYHNQWVAVVNKKVVAASKSSTAAEKRARAKTGQKRPIVVMFVETGWRVY